MPKYLDLDVLNYAVSSLAQNITNNFAMRKNAIRKIEVVDAIPTALVGISTTLEKCLRITYDDDGYVNKAGITRSHVVDISIDEIAKFSVEEWKDNTAYVIGDCVLYKQKMYKANTAHTSSTDFETDKANWDLVIGDENEYVYNVLDYSSLPISPKDGEVYFCRTDYIDTSVTPNVTYKSGLYYYDDTNREDSLTGKWRLFDGSGTISFKDYTTGVGYKAGEYVVYDNIAYKVLKDYTSYNISDDIKDGNIKQFIGNNASGLANIIEISDVLKNTKIGGDETIASSILASDINDLQLNQLVYDTNGIIAAINSIDTSANTVKLRIIHSNPDTQKVIPEPSSDDKLYFRSREVGATDGKWVEFTTVDGKTIELTINKKASSTEGSYVPKAQELVYDTDNNYIVIGDGSTSLSGLKAFYSTTVTKSDIITALGYTPEYVLQKGQANGYAPLDANGLVPVGNLPANVVSSYSKAEIDNKDAATLTSATTLINSEASTARANEEAIKKDLETHVNNTAIHVTQTDKDNWNKKVEQTDLDNYDTHIADTSIHVTQADKDKWDGMNKCYFVDNVSDLPTTNNDIGNMGYVKTSAAGITPIACATYIWDGSAWQEIDQTQVSLMFKWDNIQNKPTSTVLQIDDSVAKTHEHSNKDVLDKISQSASGNFMYDGNEIGIKVEFLDTDKDLPNVGDDDTLYVVYVDSRVRNFPSISVYRGGAFQILGRGTQDMPQQVGDMVILQNEYFSAKANTSFIITVTSNQFFSFMPVEILKKVPGATDQEKILVGTDDASSFKYDDMVVDINNGIKLTIDSIPLKLDSVSDRYLLYEDVDLSKYKNISSIG